MFKRSGSKGSVLETTYLRGEYLSGVDLRRVDLNGVIWDEKQIAYLKEGHNLYGTRVYIKKADEIISYEEYCRRKGYGDR